MLTAVRNAFRIHDLRNKILFTLFIFAIYRLGAQIPVPGVDLDAIRTFADQAEDSGFIGLLNLFSGGALTQMSIFALGIMPYITASIIMQLLAVVIPTRLSIDARAIPPRPAPIWLTNRRRVVVESCMVHSLVIVSSRFSSKLATTVHAANSPSFHWASGVELPT